MAMSYIKVHEDMQGVLKELTDAEMGKLFRAILSYATAGPKDVELDGSTRIVFQMMKAQLDRDKRCHEARVANGRKGGRPRKAIVESERQAVSS